MAALFRKKSMEVMDNQIFEVEDNDEFSYNIKEQEQLVVGMRIKVKEGMRVPADCILIKAD